jgi:signal transduction histidine kinase/CheY-like chemotaxis protein/ligand-binding sensor domain-containing protein/AraC-like DNA-binding protein
LNFLTVSSANVVSIEKKKILTFTVNDGLPRNMVTCFVQDKYGYGWVGTRNGLARFDGYSFFQYDSLKGFFVNSVILDNKNNLWAGSNHGLFAYDRLTDNFYLVSKGYIHDVSFYNGTIYYLQGKNLMKLSKNKTPEPVYNIKTNTYLIDNEGIWYSSEAGGLKLYNSDVHLLDGRSIFFIKKIGKNLFISCNNGNLFVKHKDNKLKLIDINNHHKVFDVDKVGDELWVATDGNGIIILDNELQFKKHIYNKVNNVSYLPSNSIYNIFVSGDDVIWICLYGAGLACLLPENMPFQNISLRPGNPNSLVSKEGYAVCIDGNRYLLGTNYGFSEWDIKRNKFKNFTANKLIAELNGTKVRSITKDKKNNYWIATYDGLMGKYSKDFRLLKTFHPLTKTPEEIQEIVLVYNVDKENLLISSFIPGKGLIQFNTVTGKARNVSYDKGKVRRRIWQVASIRKNQSGQMVVLINRIGLFQYIPKKNMIYVLTPEINEKLNMILNDFYHDKQGNYWIATKVEGLLKISPKGEILKKWDHKDGLSTNTVLRIESLDDRFLWLSTIDGLGRLDMKSNRLQIFDSRHGLSTNEFSPRSSLKTPDNKIIFGCSEGFVIVDPSKVIVDTSKTKVIISDIVFQNTSIKKLPNDHYLKKPLEETNKITLPFKRNSFTIKFFTNDNDLPKYNNFAYRLKGLEDNWIYPGEANHTTYTNLSPGEYVFEVKSTNKSNVWNDNPTRLTIKILPPWYLTWWAFSLYVITFLIGVFLIFQYYKKKLHWKMELDIANYKAQHEHELTEKKLTFFTNISHDLKTAATLISAPVNDLLEMGKCSEEQKRKLKVVKRNAERLFKLNVDLLEFRKITQNQLPLKVKEIDLKTFVQSIFEAYGEQCDKKGISYSLNYDIDGLVCVDPKKIEKILWNLISNAVKYTDKGGSITISVSTFRKDDDGTHIKLKVSDTGKGMSEEYLTKIFDRFYQVGKSETSLFGGVGIGLFIVKELATLHHGDISVESEPGKGSCFTVILPAERKFFEDHECANDEEIIKAGIRGFIPESEYLPEQMTDVPQKYNRQKIIIVEDNPDMRQYLFDHFSIDNTVYTAENGKLGLELIKNKYPDIIISDVKMPEMTGYELCDRIKNDFNTSHIPVILLTANTALDDKIKGMYAGADSYITKPFEIHYLDAVVNSLLENRKKLREKFIGIEPIEEDKEKFSKKDVEFINRIKELIIENISDPDLNIDTLVKHLAISRSQLNRKIKSLTGLTPNNFIKTIRLKKAYELLREKDNRVSDVAYLTGFSDPNYFTICFKKEFGENPSQISS